MKNNTDSRITVKSMGVGKYLGLFLILLLVCGSYTGLYFLQIDPDPFSKVYIILSMLTYLVVISLLLTVLFGWFRKRYLQLPVDRLREAARKVAQGDYTVRLAPMRKDGKKDEFEVLFEDFNTMTEELASTEMLKKDFISNVSHELKTPLSVIQNFATILQSDGLTEKEKQEYACRIADASQRLSVLITNILQMNRLENQKIVSHRELYNLSEQLSRCAVGYEQIWEEKEIELCAELDQNIILNNDEELLDIVWNNLISNALKFTEPGGTVCIQAKQEEDIAVITVSDTGCGIEGASLGHIFDKFYQADISHATQGNGLGLALVRQILELLEADISVDSIYGEGTTFTVRIKLG